MSEDAGRLVDNLLGAEVEESLRVRITEATAGNPLFVEELVAMLVDQGHIAPADGAWCAVGALPLDLFPDTVDAVMAARLDVLLDDEGGQCSRRGRSKGCASIAMSLPELSSLPPERLEDALAGLARKELIHRDRAEFRGDAFI